MVATDLPHAMASTRYVAGLRDDACPFGRYAVNRGPNATSAYLEKQVDSEDELYASAVAERSIPSASAWVRSRKRGGCACVSADCMLHINPVKSLIQLTVIQMMQLTGSWPPTNKLHRRLSGEPLQTIRRTVLSMQAWISGFHPGLNDAARKIENDIIEATERPELQVLNLGRELNMMSCCAARQGNKWHGVLIK